MAVTYTWSVANTERNLSDGGITVIHWACTGSETVGSGDDAVTYTASSMALQAIHQTQMRRIL